LKNKTEWLFSEVVFSIIMNKKTSILYFFFALLFVSLTQAQRNQSQFPFSEELFVVSNYSSKNNTLEKENYSIKALLKGSVRGFVFELERDSNQIYARTPLDSLVLAYDLLRPIAKTLHDKEDDLVVLFLDYKFSSEFIIPLLQQLGLYNKLWVEDRQGRWPGRRLMTKSGKQLVLFAMNEPKQIYPGIHYLWDYAVEPFHSYSINPPHTGQYKKGRVDNPFVFFTGYNLPEDTTGLNIPYKNFMVNENPFLVAHLINQWKNSGKKPNFIVMNKYRRDVIAIANNVLVHRSVRGMVTHSGRLLENVLWEGAVDAISNGSYSFPFIEGEDVLLKASKPGYKLTPDVIQLKGLERSMIQNIIATPLKINNSLRAFYPFEENLKDQSVFKHHGEGDESLFLDDFERSQVIHLADSQYIELPSAIVLGIYNHDFTIGGWIKVDTFANRDLSILGTDQSYYRKGLHLQVRNQKPYFGFFSNDIMGKTILQSEQWYYIAWRYTKRSGEQAIFVNGMLDSRSIGHPSFMGRHNLEVGKSINMHNFFNGSIDDLAIWNRPLGDEEIWNLYQDVYDLSQVSFIDQIQYRWKWYVMAAVGITILVLLWIIKVVNRRSTQLTIAFKEPQLPQKNAIRLFGGFQVFDRDSKDITHLFTPKVKMLFVAILLKSMKSKKGILSERLDSMLWPGLMRKKAANNRGVTVSKLRQVLQQIDGVTIDNDQEHWHVALSSEVFCDYYECLNLIKSGKVSSDIELFNTFYTIVHRGSLLPDIELDWLDDYKESIASEIIDAFYRFMDDAGKNCPPELIIRLCDRIFQADPINEEALKFKVKALAQLGLHNKAKYTKRDFAQRYKESLGEVYVMN